METMGNTFQGKSGKTYMVAKTPLASGGEGSVYTINGAEEFVLKEFKLDRRTKKREEKLLKMVEYHLDEEQLKQITWPQDVVYDQNGFVGYVMPRLWENRNLNVVYSTQNNQLDLRHKMMIAYNLCAAIDTVHSLNQVCGDLNPQNICVNLNLQSESALRVTLVDTDSYHITDGDKTYRCEVGLTNYLAPEIQKKLANGQDLRTASLPTFTKETDLFALAVHIFSLIMNGCHPFACAKQTTSGYEHTMEAMNDTECDSVVLPQPIDNIKDGFFPFHQEKSRVTYPLYAPDFRSLPQELQELFIRAFENGYHNPKERPTTEEWLYVLGKFQSPIEFQQCERKHYYYRNKNNKCPYCEASQRMIQMISKQNFATPDGESVKDSGKMHQSQQSSSTASYGPQNLNQGKKSSTDSASNKTGKSETIGFLDKKGLNIKTDLHITLEEAFSGCVKLVELKHYCDKCEACQGVGLQSETCSECKGVGKVMVSKKFIFGTSQKVKSCSKCHGTGRIVESKNICTVCSGKGLVVGKKEVQVQVPAGIDNNQSIRIRNKGLWGEDLKEENRGDLLIVIHVYNHPVFIRENYDLYSTINIDPEIAKNGGEIDVNTIDGKIRVTINSGTKAGTKMKIKGKGMPCLSNQAVRGDYYLTINY